jgi:hypothetical protein
MVNISIGSWDIQEHSSIMCQSDPSRKFPRPQEGALTHTQVMLGIRPVGHGYVKSELILYGYAKSEHTFDRIRKKCAHFQRVRKKCNTSAMGAQKMEKYVQNSEGTQK